MSVEGGDCSKRCIFVFAILIRVLDVVSGFKGFPDISETDLFSSGHNQPFCKSPKLDTSPNLSTWRLHLSKMEVPLSLLLLGNDSPFCKGPGEKQLVMSPMFKGSF